MVLDTLQPPTTFSKLVVCSASLYKHKLLQRATSVEATSKEVRSVKLVENRVEEPQRRTMYNNVEEHNNFQIITTVICGASSLNPGNNQLYS
jgi:hypothetical protein